MAEVTEPEVADVEAPSVMVFAPVPVLTVTIEQQGRLQRMANDAVIINAGGELPDAFLKGIGVAVNTKFGVA